MESKEMYGNEFSCNIEKGRIIIPAKIRKTYIERMKKEMEMLYGCVESYNQFNYYSLYEDFSPKRERIPVETSRPFGRIMIPLKARRTLNLMNNQKITLSGCEDKIEIWNPETLKEYLKYIRQYEPEFKSILGVILEDMRLSRTSR